MTVSCFITVFKTIDWCLFEAPYARLRAVDADISVDALVLQARNACHCTRLSTYCSFHLGSSRYVPQQILGHATITSCNLMYRWHLIHLYHFALHFWPMWNKQRCPVSPTDYPNGSTTRPVVFPPLATESFTAYGTNFVPYDEKYVPYDMHRVLQGSREWVVEM